MKVYFNQTSPYARKVRVAVHELALEPHCTLVEVDPWAEPEAFLAVNPLSRVPALVLDDGRLVTESDCIVQCLARLAPANALLPTAAPALDDAMIRAALVQGLIDASFISVIEGRRPQEQRWDAWVQRQTRAVERTTRFIESNFALASGRFDIGDVSLACALGYLDFRLPALVWRRGNPKLAAWFDEAAQRPSMRATQP